MKILITGATGLLGQAIVNQAQSQGIEIHYLSSSKSKMNQFPSAKGYFWNPSEGILDTDCFKGVTAIFHLAGATVSKPWTKSYKKQILSSRVESTRLLVSKLKDFNGSHSIEQIISASAVGIYPSDQENTLNESSPVSPRSFMEQVVIEWEKEVDAFVELNIAITKFRIGLVLTTKGGVLGPLKILTSLGLGAAFGNGKQGQSWIHVDDVVGLFLKALKERWEGVYNAVAPNPVSQTDFIKALAKALKRPYFLPSIPKTLLTLVIGEMSSLVLDSHWISAQKILDKGYEFKYPELIEAMNAVIGQAGK